MDELQASICRLCELPDVSKSAGGGVFTAGGSSGGGPTTENLL